MSGEEDAFDQYLSQDQGEHYVEQVAASDQAADPSESLRVLVQCAHRQEQLLGKMCGLMMGLDSKLQKLADGQESLEQRMQHISMKAAATPSAGVAKEPTARGAVVAPPGRTVGPPSVPLTAEQQAKLEADRLVQERVRIEEEGKKRAEELSRKRVEDEKRKRAEEERRRIELEKRRVEEQKRKSALQNKTTGLMSGLLGSEGRSSLFEEGPTKTGKGGLFDD